MRARTGVGQRIDVAMIDVALNLMGPRIAATGGPTRPAVRPAVGRFKAQDRMLFIMGAHQRWFEVLSEVLGPPSLVSDPRFADPKARITHARELRETIEARLAARPAAQWEQLLTGAGLPAAMVRRTDEFTASEHVRARGLLTAVKVDDRDSAIDAVGPPYRLMDAALAPQGSVPKLGADTDAVLTELHYSPAQIGQLRARRII
jgi:crotonobetainyl-CoA:carnitine CoA-transferase CaiB-like acyl-CoA transferase